MFDEIPISTIKLPEKRRRFFPEPGGPSGQVLLKPQSDIHCNRCATSPRPKFKTIAEVAEESQLGLAVGRRLIGDWLPTSRGPLCDLMQLVADRSRLVADQVNLKL